MHTLGSGTRRDLLAGVAGGFLATIAELALDEHNVNGGESAYPWRVGTSRVQITPPLEVGILMSSGRGEWAPFEGVRMPLQARVAAIQSGSRLVALVALDLLGLADEAVGGMREFKRTIAAHAENAYEPDQFVLAASHTHSAPASLALTNLHHTKPFQDWVKTLALRIGAGLKEAGSRLRACRRSAGRRPVRQPASSARPLRADRR